MNLNLTCIARKLCIWNKKEEMWRVDLVLQESCALEQERGDVKSWPCIARKLCIGTRKRRCEEGGGPHATSGIYFLFTLANKCLSKGDSEGLNVFDLDESEHFDFVMLFGWVTHGHSLTKSTLAIGNPWIDYLRKWVSTKANKGRCKIKRAIPWFFILLIIIGLSDCNILSNTTSFIT